MLASVCRSCCRILSKHLSYKQQITWLFLMVLLAHQLQYSDSKPTKWNHSIQRRFMWKQMDSTVDGFVDRVVTGARVMKSMIGEFMPPKQGSSNAMDYLPTETTRIKYIIRNPHTKETKVIRVRPSKKVVKLMAMTPRPLLADKPKSEHIIEPEYVADKWKSMYMKEPDYTPDKFKTVFMIDPDKLRQLEKEQEMIAEGRIPIKSQTKPIYMTYKTERPKEINTHFNMDDDIVSGRIREFNESWKPVYKGDTPTGFTTSKPYMMSALHTSVVGELIPEPQKQIYEPLTSNEFPAEEPKKSHTYEVTEYTAEESVLQPYTHEYYNPESPTDLLPSQADILPLKHSSVITESPHIITQIEGASASKNYHSDYRSPHEFLPSRGSYRLNEETSTTTSSPSTTTTTEEPNYPAAFLKQIRNHPESSYNPKGQKRSKPAALSFENSWIPSNATFTRQRTRSTLYHQHLPSSLRTKSQKWPPDVENTYLNSEPPLAYEVSTTTEVPFVPDFTTEPILSNTSSRKTVPLSPHYSSFTEAKHRTVRHRGSVKYGDKLEIDQR